MVKLVYTHALGACGIFPWRFESSLAHQQVLKQKMRKMLRHNRLFITSLIVLILVIIGHFYYFLDRQNRVQMIEGLAQNDPQQLELQLQKMVTGYPIEAMVPFIAKQDPIVAGFIIGIAKKESNWGKRVPLLDGKDCFNYWGFRGGGDLVTRDGYTCFDSPAEAVEVVGNRISQLVYEYNLDTPNKMIVWKCGSTCAGHDAYGVKKWISDVNLYFQKIIN